MRNSWQVATAAEAFAAAQFARCGWDVSVQYGANQPEYDLMAVREDTVFKVSVKGSQDGAWGLTQSYLQNADYHGAIGLWLARHSAHVIFCLVQFYEVPLDQLPRMYLARPQEIANWLRAAAAGRGDTTLHEYHAWNARAQAAGTIDEIPADWMFSSERLDCLIEDS